MVEGLGDEGIYSNMAVHTAKAYQPCIISAMVQRTNLPLLAVRCSGKLSEFHHSDMIVHH
jgi:hypothetical protein